MVYVIGASSLEGALATLTEKQKNRIKGSVKAIKGLSFNPLTKDPKKRVQFYLSGELAGQKNIVIWHDVLNNSVSAHSSNNFNPQSITDLKITLARYSDQISALVVCQREFKKKRTPDLYRTLQETGILTLGVLKDLISKRNAKNLQKEYLRLHQKPKYERKTFYLIRNYSYNLSRFKTKRKNCPNPRRRRAFKNRQRQTELSQSAQ